ncbi:MAG: catalase [Lachnospiraceae bacterium]|nr:catalase [Lachnospiraceae bacterium]MBO7362956.1 catalase [Lachnospiraceae bacterium]MBO7530848.1 catalase [Lachnospiraceae bacterium]MBP5702779.1 catalase [Lachnospiraceae bacterium]
MSLSFFKRFTGHFMTITRHKKLVCEGCFKAGLYYQGIVHDLSKYSPSEFLVGVRYYQGTRSPNNAEREDHGYSAAWLHHKGRNKHHYEYWVDYNTRGRDPGEDVMIPVEMPYRYFAEMVIDRIAASKVYKGKDYTDASPLEYFYSGIEMVPMHPNTRRDLQKYLRFLAKYGEEKTYRLIRHEMSKRYGLHF